MATPTANWTAAAARSGAEPVMLLEITIDGTTTLRAAHALAGQQDAVTAPYPDSIESLTPLATTLDPVDRTVSIGAMTAEMRADGLGKGWIQSYWLKGKTAKVLLGFRDLAIADYVQVFGGFVERATPRPDGGASIRLSTAFAKFRDAELPIFIIDCNPLYALTQTIFPRILDAADWDTVSFDQATAANAAFAHWVLWSWKHADWQANGRKAKDVVDEVCAITGGCVRPGENGKLAFVPWNPAGSVVYTFTDDEIRDFAIEDSDNVINRVAVRYDGIWDGKATVEFTAWRNATDSQAALKAFGGPDAIVAKEQRLELVHNFGVMRGTLSSLAGAGSTFDLTPTGFCGTAWPTFPNGIQPAWAKVGPSNTAFIKLQSMLGFVDEIIEVDQITVATSTQAARPTADAEAYGGVTYDLPDRITCRIKTRGVNGTTVQNFGLFTMAYDVTIAKAIGERLTSRFRYGAPVVKFKTPITVIGPEYGDLVGLTTSKWFGYGMSSSDATAKWEVIGKEISPSECEITWRLCLATRAGLPAETNADYHFGREDSRFGGLGMANRDVMQPKVVGLLVTAGAGLTANLSSCRIAVGSEVVRYPSVTLTLAATKDNYIAFDVVCERWVIIPVTIGNPCFPELYQCQVAKVTTDGAGVTAIQAISQGQALVDGTVVGPDIATAAVTTPSIAAGAVAPASINSAYGGRNLGRNQYLDP